jgi:hypothetical protein
MATVFAKFQIIFGRRLVEVLEVILIGIGAAIARAAVHKVAVAVHLFGRAARARGLGAKVSCDTTNPLKISR